jgi:hypothetical protein
MMDGVPDMQLVTHQPALSGFPVAAFTARTGLSPMAMAGHLRRTNPDVALCFARAMYDDAAWANEGWGAYWADVMRLISLPQSGGHA